MQHAVLKHFVMSDLHETLTQQLTVYENSFAYWTDPVPAFLIWMELFLHPWIMETVKILKWIEAL